jgi:single-strand DNA-binding protein
MIYENLVVLVGRLGETPQIEDTAEGEKWARFKLGTTERRTNDSGEKTKKTEWHTLVAKGRATRACENLRKGELVYLRGQLESRHWTDANSIFRKETYVSIIVIRSLSGKWEKRMAGEDA